MILYIKIARMSRVCILVHQSGLMNTSEFFNAVPSQQRSSSNILARECCGTLRLGRKDKKRDDYEKERMEKTPFNICSPSQHTVTI